MNDFDAISSNEPSEDEWKSIRIFLTEIGQQLAKAGVEVYWQSNNDGLDIPRLVIKNGNNFCLLRQGNGDNIIARLWPPDSADFKQRIIAIFPVGKIAFSTNLNKEPVIGNLITAKEEDEKNKKTQRSEHAGLSEIVKTGPLAELVTAIETQNGPAIYEAIRSVYEFLYVDLDSLSEDFHKHPWGRQILSLLNTGEGIFNFLTDETINLHVKLSPEKKTSEIYLQRSSGRDYNKIAKNWDLLSGELQINAIQELEIAVESKDADRIFIASQKLDRILTGMSMYSSNQMEKDFKEQIIQSLDRLNTRGKADLLIYLGDSGRSRIRILWKKDEPAEVHLITIPSASDEEMIKRWKGSTQDNKINLKESRSAQLGLSTELATALRTRNPAEILPILIKIDQALTGKSLELRGGSALHETLIEFLEEWKNNDSNKPLKETEASAMFYLSDTGRSRLVIEINNNNISIFPATNSNAPRSLQKKWEFVK